MTKGTLDVGAAWWGKSLDDVDSEILRLCAICHVKILEPGVIERVLGKDATVCGSANPLAFDKLRNALIMHYQVRVRSVDAIGEAKTAALIGQIVERLRQRVGRSLG
jgi:hypothetical protein